MIAGQRPLRVRPLPIGTAPIWLAAEAATDRMIGELVGRVKIDALAQLKNTVRSVRESHRRMEAAVSDEVRGHANLLANVRTELRDVAGRLTSLDGSLGGQLARLKGIADRMEGTIAGMILQAEAMMTATRNDCMQLVQSLTFILTKATLGGLREIVKDEIERLEVRGLIRDATIAAVKAALAEPKGT
jgi:hypothetical protein